MFISPEAMIQLWRINPIGVLHVGAHLGEEKPEYERYGFGKIFWVEANPMLCDRLNNSHRMRVFKGWFGQSQILIENSMLEGIHSFPRP